MKEINTYEKTRRIFPPFSLFIRAASLIARSKERVKITKLGKLPKPPYLLICNHASFMDFYTAIKVTEPHQPYWVSTIEEFIDKDFIFRELGILPKRKFTNDPISAKMMMEVLKDRKKILIIYPEARYSFIGKMERIERGIASIAKVCNVPIVLIKNHGHFLRDPQWGDHHVRKIRPIHSTVKCIISKKYIKELSVDEIYQTIVENLKYDEEQYQIDNHILNTYKNRAVGIEHILYKCPHCGEEFKMTSFGSHFKCENCKKEYSYNSDGTISCINGETKFSRISQWYEYEKECVKNEVKNNRYYFKDEVRLEHLDGVKVGFSPLKGKYYLTQSVKDGIKVIDEDNKVIISKMPLQTFAIHVEFDYKHKGGCVDLATNEDTYFVYPLHFQSHLTKIHFATEAIFDNAVKNLNKEHK